MGLEDFPCEVLELIFGYLGVSDRLSASSVCKQWYYASLNINLWKDAAVCINTEKAAEGVLVLTNCERPFSSVIFEDCNDFFLECSRLFLCVIEMCRVIGPRLSALVFKNCTLSGSEFTEILAECPNLQHLSVIDCESLFSSKVLVRPEKVNQLKLSLQNVKELNLSCNKNLSDMYFTQLAQLFSKVKSLSLMNCPINFHPVVFRRYYPRHETIPSDNILTFSWVKGFICNNATIITSVNFSRTDIDNMALKMLAHVEGLQLESISLSHCHLLTSSGIRDFCHCQKKLKKLELPVSLVLDQVLPEICTNLTELRELSIGRHWPPEKVPLLRALETHALIKLVKLDLHGCCDIIVLKFIDSLRNEAYPRLRHLSLRKNKVDDYVFIYMVPYVLHITYLDLSATQITDKSLVLISIHLVHLRFLSLAQCKAITDQGLTGNIETYPLLFNSCIPEDSALHDSEEMRFGNRQFLKWLVFEDEDHSISLSNLKGLKELNIYDIRGISDDGIKTALVFKELTVLSLGGCSSITDEGLVAIGQNNRSLEVLSLKHSTHITENGIEKILSYLPRLKLLDLEGCKKLTDSVLCDLVKARSFKLKYLL